MVHTLLKTSYSGGSIAWHIFCRFEPKKKASEARMSRTNPKRNVSPTSLEREREREYNVCECVSEREFVYMYVHVQYVYICGC